MKMSPLAPLGEVQPSLPVVDCYAARETLVQVDAGAGEAEAVRLRRDLKSTSFPLHHVVVADDAFMNETADAVQILGRGAPGFLGFTRGAREAAVVIRQEAGQEQVGGLPRSHLGETELTDQPVLKAAPQAFDAPFGLGGLSGDEGDAQLLQRAAELCGLAAAAQFLFPGPVLVVAHEDAAVVAVEAERDAVAPQNAV